jgi:hypothetical protein
MKRAVSISIGSSRRDKSVQVELLGEQVLIERIGTDGDMQRAAQLYRELDGLVDAFGVGGTDLALQVEDKVYPLHSVLPMVRDVKQTPIADGSGLKNTLEAGLAAFIDEKFPLGDRPRTALVTSGADRWGMAQSFYDAGYRCIFGDLMFGLGLPVPVRSKRALRTLAALLLPIVGRLPFAWLYPTGEKQEQRTPRWGKYYRWATVIAGDCHYIKRYMPDSLPDKIIVTNTTTEADVETFRQAGAACLVTSTPVLEGRSFGTNMMEAALIAVAGKGRKLTQAEIEALIAEIGLEPQLQILNPLKAELAT